ncbi:hypothetical protein SLA2020_314270 [Shorea laevis]
MYVDPQGYLRGLALWWTDEVNISIFSSDKNMIDGCCSEASFSSAWHFSFVYGEPIIQLRSTMWNRILNLRRPEFIPWSIIGDLNLIGDSRDKKGKRPPPQIDRTILEKLISSCSLWELSYRRSLYTWARGNIRERLDRALINDAWSQLFPNAELFHCTRIGSDHCPLLLSLKAIPTFPKRQFRYELKWQLQEGYEAALAQGWTTDRTSSPLFCMASKLSQCRQSLKEWSKMTVGHSRQELEQLQHELQTLQLEEQIEMTLSRQEFLIDRINHLWRQDEAY